MELLAQGVYTSNYVLIGHSHHGILIIFNIDTQSQRYIITPVIVWIDNLTLDERERFHQIQNIKIFAKQHHEH